MGSESWRKQCDCVLTRCSVNLSLQRRALHKATICPSAMCVFPSISIHSEFAVIFHLIPLAWLARRCFAFK